MNVYSQESGVEFPDGNNINEPQKYPEYSGDPEMLKLSENTKIETALSFYSQTVLDRNEHIQTVFKGNQIDLDPDSDLKKIFLDILQKVEKEKRDPVNIKVAKLEADIIATGIMPIEIDITRKDLLSPEKKISGLIENSTKPIRFKCHNKTFLIDSSFTLDEIKILTEQMIDERKTEIGISSKTERATRDLVLDIFERKLFILEKKLLSIKERDAELSANLHVGYGQLDTTSKFNKFREYTNCLEQRAALEINISDISLKIKEIRKQEEEEILLPQW